MKKTILLMSLFLLTSIMTFAVPALPGIWHNITLEDGTTVYAQLKGDETVNFYEDKEGNIYMANEDGTYSLTSADTFKKKASKRRAKFSAISHTSPKRVAGVGNKFFGSKRCLILLAEFPNKKFKDGHDKAQGRQPRLAEAGKCKGHRKPRRLYDRRHAAWQLHPQGVG